MRSSLGSVNLAHDVHPDKGGDNEATAKLARARDIALDGTSTALVRLDAVQSIVKATVVEASSDPSARSEFNCYQSDKTSKNFAAT